MTSPALQQFKRCRRHAFRVMAITVGLSMTLQTTAHTSSIEDDYNIDEILALEVTPSTPNALVVFKSKRGEEEPGCRVTLVITVEGEVEANGDTSGLYDEVLIRAQGLGHTLFAGDATSSPPADESDDFVGARKRATATVEVSVGDEIELQYLTRNNLWNDGWGAKVTDVQVAPPECASCEGGSGEAGDDAPSLELGLGSTPIDGRDPGSLLLPEGEAAPDRLLASGLTLASGAYNATEAERALAAGQVPSLVALNTSGQPWAPAQTIPETIRQVISPARFIDVIEPVAGQGFEIRVYPREGLGARDPISGLFAIVTGAQPLETWSVAAPSGGPTDGSEIEITRTHDGLVETTSYSWSAPNQGWETTKGTGNEAVSTRVMESTSGAIREERTETRNADDDLVAVSIEKWQTFDFGERLVESSSGDGLERQSTTYEYWPTGSGNGAGHVRRISHPGGRWEYFHEYASDGRPTRKVEQIGDNPFTGTWPDNANKMLQFTHTSSTAVRRTETLTSIAGTPVRREWLNHYRPIDLRTHPSQTLLESNTLSSIAPDPSITSIWDSRNINTTTYFYPKNATAPGLPNEPRKKTYPDGTVSHFEYATAADGSLTTIEQRGIDNGSGGVSEGTKTTTTIDKNGYQTAFTRHDIPQGGSPILVESTIATAFDAQGRPSEFLHHDGTTTEIIHGCCGVHSETAKDGIETVFGYDSHRRVETEETFAGTRLLKRRTHTYDAAGRQTSISTTDGSGTLLEPPTVAEFDTAGRLISETSGGVTSSHTYSPDGLTTTRTTTGGLTEVTVRYSDGRIKSRTGTALVAEHHTYGVISGLEWSEVRYGSASSPRWVRTTTDPLGRVFKTERPAFGGGTFTEQNFHAQTGRLEKITRTGLADYRFEYDALGRTTREGWDLDGDGTLLPASTDRITETTRSHEESAGGTWFVENRFTYPTNGSAATIPLGTTKTRLTGLSASRVSEQQSLLPGGIVIATVEAIDAATRTRTLTTTSSDSSQPAILIYTDGLLVSEGSTRHEGTAVILQDSLGRETSRTDPRVNTITETNYDPVFFQPQTVTAAERSSTTTYHPPAHPNAGLPALINQDGRILRRAYNSRGQLTGEWGHTYPVRYEYNDLGEMTGMLTYRNAPEDLSSSEEWPATLGAPDVTIWEHDPATGLLAAKEDAAGRRVEYTYHPDGRLHTRTNSRNITTTYGYDTTGVLTGVDYSDATPDVARVPDRLGRPTTITQGGVTYTPAYDPATGLPLGESRAGAGFDASVDLIRDSLGRRHITTATFGAAPGSNLLNRTLGYDTFGRVGSVEGRPSTTAPILSAVYSHATNSELISDIAFSHGGTAAGSVAKTFDVWDGVDLIETRLADNTPVARADYEIDARGRRRERAEADGARWEFAYNGRDEVTGGVRKSADDEPLPGWEFGYEFDGIGNRVTSSEAGSGSIYTPNNLNQIAVLDRPGVWHLRGEALPEATVTVNDTPVTRTGALFHKALSFDNSTSALLPEAFVSSVLTGENPGDPDRVDERTGTRYIPKASATPQYDLDGNLLNDGRWAYEWDAESRLVAMQKLPGIEAPMRLEFTYDYQSRRTKSTKKVWDTGTSSFIIHTSTFFLWDGWMMLGEATTTEGSAAPPTPKSYLWGIDLNGSEEGAGTVGGLLAAWIDSSPHIIAQDANGNITAAINATTQTVSARYDYAPFGEPLRATGPIANTLPFRWSSKYTDNESGLVYYGYRFYDPLTGTWINRDPIEEQGGVNLYGFVGNQCIGKVDRLGLRGQKSRANGAIRGRGGDSAMDSALGGMFTGTKNSVRHFGPDHPWTQDMRQHEHLDTIRATIRGQISSFCGGNLPGITGQTFPASFELNQQSFMANVGTYMRDIFAGLQLTSSAHSMGSFRMVYIINAVDCSKCTANVTFDASDALRLGSLTRVPGTGKSALQFIALAGIAPSTPGAPMSQQQFDAYNEILSMDSSDFDEPLGPNAPFNTVYISWSWSESVGPSSNQ